MESIAPSQYWGIKQPEGCLSAHQMQVLCSTVRAADPSKPLHVHTQGIHGLSELQAYAAAMGGATSIDASVPFFGLAGQPFAPSLREEFVRQGFRVNAWDDSALVELLDQSKQVESFYPIVSKPDRRYPSVSYGANIAGGQSSILKDELRALGLAHIYPEVEAVNPISRRCSGSGVAVTPLADTFVRQTMTNVRNGVSGTLSAADKELLLKRPLLDPALTPLLERFELTDPYALLLFGDNGLLPSYPHPVFLQKAADFLFAKAASAAGLESLAGALATAALLLSEQSRVTTYKQQIQARMSELRALDQAQRRQVEIDIALSGQLDFDGAAVRTVEDRLALFQAEHDRFPTEHAVPLSSEEYDAFLTTGNLSSQSLALLLQHVPALPRDTQPNDAVMTLLQLNAPLTVLASQRKADRLGPVDADIKAWEADLALKLPEYFRDVQGLIKRHV
jgi:hypothetical protein